MDERTDAVAALAGMSSARSGLAELLDDLPLRAHRSWAPGRAVATAISWNLRDRFDWRWFPQGVTSSADASDSELAHGRRVLVTSWYSKFGHRGSRLTFLDLDRLRYQHVLLVVPTVRDGQVTLAPLHVHAGGIVWIGDWIHVAATSAGFFTAYVDDVRRTPPELAEMAGGAPWVLPVRITHVADSDGDMAGLRYSFMSLDRAESALMVGEYGVKGNSTRLAWFPLDPDTGLPTLDEAGHSRPLLVSDEGVESAQGAVSVDQVTFVSASHGRRRRGSMYVGKPGAWTRFRAATPPGPEDVTWWGSTDQIWTNAEHPGIRWVVAMNRSWFDESRER